MFNWLRLGFVMAIMIVALACGGVEPTEDETVGSQESAAMTGVFEETADPCAGLNYGSCNSNIVCGKNGQSTCAWSGATGCKCAENAIYW